MSMLADLKRVCINAQNNYAIGEEDCAGLFLDILGAIEWDFRDMAYEAGIDYDPDSMDEEVLAAKKYLFGEEDD